MKDCIGEREPSNLPMLLCDGRDATKANQRGTARRVQRHAACDGLISEHAQVRFEFLLQVTIEAATGKSAELLSAIAVLLWVA